MGVQIVPRRLGVLTGDPFGLAIASPAAGGGWSPAQLDAFMASQSDGLHFDTTKLDRFFQENTGPTLADDVGEAMGRALSQRAWNGRTLAQELAASTELLSNGDGSVTTGWVANFGTITSVDGRFRITNTDGVSAARASKTVTCIVGRTYQIAWEGFNGTTNPLMVVNTSVNLGGALISVVGLGAQRAFFVATATTMYINIATSGAVVGTYSEFDNISVKEVPGKHGIQATGTLKPVRQTTGAKFDGSDDNWLTSYLAGAGENFLVALVDVPASISAFQYIAGAVDAGSTERFGIGINTNGRAGFGLGTKSPVSVGVGVSDLRGSQATVGLTFDGATVRGFVDGDQEYTDTQSGTAVTTIPVRLGSLNSGGTAGNFFGGSIKKLIAGREFLDLATYLKIRTALLT